MSFFRLGLCALTWVWVAACSARPFMVVAYNVENLVDLDGITSFEDYRPARYTRAHALTKLQNIAKVVAQFESGRGPDVLLLSELEVDFTPARSPLDYSTVLDGYRESTLAAMLGEKFDQRVADLPAEALLLKALSDRSITGYHVVVADNVTAAGTARKLEHKCAVFTRFPVRSSRSHPTADARAILEVLIEVDGAPLYLFSNHWKSGASDPETEKTRIANARTLRQRVDEILRVDPNADVIIGGDLNSQYNQRQRYPAMKQTGINDVLGSQGNELAVRGQRSLYNLWFELPAEQRGSDTFRGEWGTLMHLLITRGLYDFRGVQYVDNSFGVGKFPGLNADAKGLPVRWSFDGPAGSGFSDHFPVFAKFITVPDGRADRYLALRRASVEEPGPAPSTRIDYAGMDLDKLALKPGQLAPGTEIRADNFKGKLFRVEGRVAPGTRLAVEFRGQTFDVWSFDETLRAKLRANYPAGAPIKFFGELGVYRERWQFVIQDPSWVR